MINHGGGDRMNKPIISFIFCCMLLSMLSGCDKEEKTTLTILAAASLTESFTDLEKGFEAAYPDINLEFSFAGTGTLMSQVKEGIDADVFVSANEASIENLVQSGFIKAGTEKVFAYNEPVLMVSKKTSYKIESLEDVLQEGVKIVIAEPSQPIGKYTEEIVKNIDAIKLFDQPFSEPFYAHVVSKESSVKGVAVKIEIGEADVGIVYATDFTSMNQEKVYSVEIPTSCNLMATYELAPLANSKNLDEANQFVDYISEAEGQQYLIKYGFLLPE